MDPQHALGYALLPFATLVVIASYEGDVTRTLLSVLVVSLMICSVCSGVLSPWPVRDESL